MTNLQNTALTTPYDNEFYITQIGVRKKYYTPQNASNGCYPITTKSVHVFYSKNILLQLLKDVLVK